MVGELLRADPDAGRGSRNPRFSEFSPEVEALSDITDRLGDVVRGISGMASGKRSRPIKAVPRPKTAFDRIGDIVDQERHDRLVARMLPPEQRAATDAVWDELMAAPARKAIAS